jgi:AcrR family transcriptional regulator
VDGHRVPPWCRPNGIQRHEQTRRDIVDASWALARERGLTGWALRDVADVLGMRAPSLYVYVDSKNAIYDAVFAGRRPSSPR